MQTPHIRDYQGKRVHMIGIGGSSMSGLAQMLAEKGYRVTGSDNVHSHSVEKLEGMGIPVAIGHREENVRGADVVVYSAAILPDNPERQEIQRLLIPNMERAMLLGQLMEGYQTAVGISGTHGKTTTTAMLSQIMMECGLDPTIHIGGRLDAVGGSTRIGSGNSFIAEACEFSGSFLYMRPTVAVVLNIEEDHLDYYKDIDDIQNAFGAYLNLLPENGLAIGWGDDFRVLKLFAELDKETQTFGFDGKNDWQPTQLRYDSLGRGEFDLLFQGKKLCHVTMAVPGSFNVLNGLAALACAHRLGADMEKAAAALGRFIGAHRRFELTGIVQGVKLYHDYGHNPTEMRNALSVAKLQPHNRLWAVMQPHTYSRVKRLFGDYLTCTKAADITLVTDIYAAREKDPGDIHASMVVSGMRENGIDAYLTPSFNDTEAYLRAHWQPGDLVITMGCGNINLLNEQIERNEQKGTYAQKPESALS